MSSWLPDGLISPAQSRAASTVLNLAWCATIFLAFLVFCTGVRRSLREQGLTLATAVPVMAMGLCLVWGFSQLIKNVYETATILPLIALATIFAFSRLSEMPAFWRFARHWAFIVIGVGLASQAAVAAIFAPVLWHNGRSPAYIDGQPMSVATLGYRTARPQLEAAAKSCDIALGPQSRHILVDDATYFAAMTTYQPYHRLGVVSGWNGGISDPVAYLASRNSDGLLMGCRYLPPGMRRQAKATGAFCCMSKALIDRH